MSDKKMNNVEKKFRDAAAQAEKEGVSAQAETPSASGDDAQKVDWSLLSDSTAITEISFLVDNEEGGSLKTPDLYKEMRTLLDTPKEELLKGSNPLEVIEKFEDLVKKYFKQVNAFASTNDGIVTKYRILLGRVFLKFKELIEATDLDWTKWARNNFRSIGLRSKQDYMQLAQQPKIDDYAVFGKERIMMILRAIKGSDSIKKDDPDPIGNFLKLHKVNFDPEADTPIEEVQLQIDVAVEQEKLRKKKINVPEKLVENLVRNRMTLKGAYLTALKASDNPEATFRKLLVEGTIKPPVTPDSFADAFKKTAARLSRDAAKLSGDPAYRAKVDEAVIRELIEALQAIAGEQAAVAA